MSDKQEPAAKSDQKAPPKSKEPTKKKQVKKAPSKSKKAAKQPAVPQVKIINLQGHTVRVMTSGGTQIVPPNGLEHGEYPSSMLQEPHFLDLTSGPNPVLQKKQL